MLVSVSGLLLLGALLLVAAPPASAASLVAKDGKIHACYKVKGKGKGTLRVVRSAKARCPKKWKKVAWDAGGSPGAQGAPGAPGAAGEPGSKGETGLPGRNENAVVNELEDKVTELLGKVQALESLVANLGALEGVVGSLCTQTEALNEQSGKLGGSLSALNAVLAVAFPLLSLPTVPVALPPYTCPTL